MCGQEVTAAELYLGAKIMGSAARRSGAKPLGNRLRSLASFGGMKAVEAQTKSVKVGITLPFTGSTPRTPFS